MNIGITGQSGFIGYHVYNTIKYCHKDLTLVEFKDEYFENEDILKKFLGKCDVIIHLAALNRHNVVDEIYKTNVGLVEKIVRIMQANNFKPYIIFASSIQEYKDNSYGRSKKAGRMLFEKWAKDNNSKLISLILPNIYGVFGLPFYNSVISTFSHQLTHNLEPKIEIDAKLSLLYVNDLADYITKIIKNPIEELSTEIDAMVEFKVSSLLSILNEYRQIYFVNKIIPLLDDKFKISLFNTFRSHINPDYFPVYLEKSADERGFLSELIKTKNKGQVFYSVTKPGITRGNHFHRRKIERFIVLKGKAIIRFRKIGTTEIKDFSIDGTKPAYIDIPIYYTHNIENIGSEDLITLFWTNEFFTKDDPDTYFEKV